MILLGTQGWGYTAWRGRFYPESARQSDFLRLYAERFPVVELDTTFYGVPSEKTIRGWDASTPDGFEFTAKMPRAITHDRGLVDCTAEVDEFVSALSLLGPKLGAILIQLPPSFTSVEWVALEGFLSQLPDGPRYAIEFRHRSWLHDRTYDLLEHHSIAWTMIDLPYMPRVVRTTADFAYVRWLGDHKRDVFKDPVRLDRHEDLEAWAEKLDEVARNVQRVYGFANNHYSGHSPDDIHYLQRLLGIESDQSQVPRQGSLL
jgi:uncharacterized protein YecE (DUF72 family)